MKLDMYDVCDSEIVSAIIDFKWLYFVRTTILSLLSLTLTHYALTAWLYHVVLDMAHDRDSYTPLKGSWQVSLCAIVTTISLMMLSLVSYNALAVGVDKFIRHMSAWKVLTILCYFTQLCADVMLIARIKSGLVYICTLNMILFVVQCVSYLRGLEHLGVIISMINAMAWEIRHFAVITLITMFGYALAASFILRNYLTPWRFLSYWDMGFFGGDSGASDNLWSHKNRVHNAPALATLHILAMVLIVLFLLNLLIAIMNDAYIRISATISIMHTFQKAQIILDVQAIWLPVIAALSNKPKEYFTPNWLRFLDVTDDLANDGAVFRV